MLLFKNNRLSRLPGLTLMEVMMAMSILVMLAAGIIGGVFTVRADAENNLYESSSLNVAISFLEQMKSIEYVSLENPPLNGDSKPSLNFIVGGGQDLNIPLDEDVTVQVPIISDVDGSSKKELPVVIHISLAEATDFRGYWIEVDYSWKHPTSDRTYSGEIRGFRSEISTF